MGKGSRNRQLHLQEKVDHPEKFKKKKQAPKWLGSVIALVVVAAILVTVVANIIISNGIVQRSRIVVESQTGKFDVTQPMATFIAWQTQYYNGYYYYLYCQYGMITDTYGITSTYSSGDEYALVAAQSSVQNQLRDCVDDVMESLIAYVAVCDEAYRAGVKLDDSDKESVKEGIAQLEEMQTSYGYSSLNSFLKVAMYEGMKKSDVEDALELVALYNKYCAQMQVSYEKAVTLSDLETYRDANPEDFYKIDYLTYAAEDEAFAQQLAACKTAQAFKDLVLKKHLDDNYKTVYNKYTVTVNAKNDLAAISGKTDGNEGTALSTALTEIGAGAAQDYSASDETLNADLKAWLFNTERKQFDTSVVTTDDGIYVVAFLSEAANETTVNARYKFLPFESGETNGDDTKFKENIYTYLTESKKDEPTYPTVDYKTASDKATALKALLEAEGADIPSILKDYSAVDKTGVTTTTSTTELPKEVRDAATEEDAAAGDVLTVKNDDGIYYVVYISSIEDGKTNLSYATVENDLYYQIINDLTDTLDDVYPTDQTANYDADAEENTFEAWISALAEAGKFVSARKENDTAYFTETEEGEGDEADKTVYNAYIVINTPLYLDTEMVVKGGYLLYSDEGYADEANTAVATLKGKTDTDLLNALSALSSSATSSNALKESSISDENLKAWLFSDDRTANDSAVVTNTANTGAYVAAFAEKTEAWKSTAKSSYVSEKLEDWMEELSADYSANEKVLKKLGEPTTTEAETATA